MYYCLGNDHFNGVEEKIFFDYVYFSATVQATIGFGDITPRTRMAKFLVMIQQLVVVFITASFIFNAYEYKI
jgi:uncharacterized membrane protein